MYSSRHVAAACASIIGTAYCSPASAVDLRYTWMLPKTVIDATIVYTLQDCSDAGAKIKIAPTLAGRAVPDMRVGQKELALADLTSSSQDKNISINTFANSRILSSLGSQPTSQASTIAGNILGSIAKVVGIALGTAPVASGSPGADNVPRPTCATGDNTASDFLKQIKDAKTNILKYQKELAGGVEEATQKRDNAAITAAQSLITALQDKLTITIKTTIDPGVSPVQVDTTLDVPPTGDQNGEVGDSGLVAAICPSRKQLDDAKWFGFLDQAFANGRKACEAMPSLQVSVYLDFKSGHSTMFNKSHTGSYPQTDVAEGQEYRDVAYIPVLVWRGEKTAAPVSRDSDGAITGAVALAPPQTLAFGQFGVAQQLKVTADTFQSLAWSVNFLENGEITSATFSSKAWAANATSLFGSAVNAANSIATEERNASSPSTQATAIQGQADLIYQQQRLHLCETTPLSCPSK